MKKTSESNDKMEEQLAELNSRQEDLSGQIKQKQEDYMKEAQEPIRITKHNESTSQGVDKLEDELKKLLDVKKKHEFDMKTLKAGTDKANAKIEDNSKELEYAENELRDINKKKKEHYDQCREYTSANKEMQAKNAKIVEEVTEIKG